MEEKYILNPYISIKRVGLNKFYIKQSILSKKSFVLETNDLDKRDKEFLSNLSINSIVSYEDCSQELMDFLLEESIITYRHMNDIEYYYKLINKDNSISSIKDSKVAILCNNEKIKKIMTMYIEDLGINFDFIDFNSLKSIKKNQFDMIIGLYSHFDSLLFHRINEILIEKEVPFMINFIDGGNSYISPIFIKGETVCYNEMEVQLEAALFYKTEYIAYKDEIDKQKPLISYFVNNIIFYSLHLSLDFLITKKLRTKNRAFLIDSESLRYDIVDIMPLPNCLGCQKNNKIVHDYL
ncbi:hypothetical protein [Macrococcus capreoli]|uniref:hypothetical protein n=1 Tax=Macrococcus capreoli TaxID=2982690 RepID=UPI0021D5F9AD|nr:hypothetical protein [Macrococcus sp. TMW 2.2395]MCU7558623.1 hypothetical protein [Macrococcus sp. TMW 2.2395]